MVKEVITIAVGQCGIQCSNAAWELYCLEHCVSADGLVNDMSILEEDDSYMSFFELGTKGQLVPRSLNCDLESTVIDEIRVGFYRNLFHPDTLISGTEDAANNYARGHFTVGKGKINVILDRLRKTAQNCEKLEGFLIINGYGGGTGSGLCDLITEKLNTEFSKRTKVQTAIFPGNKYSTSMVEPYNCVLSAHTGISDVDLAIQFDNDACYDISRKHLSLHRPSYNNINRLISQVLSSVTCSIRFKNALDSDLTMMQVNMVPYPRIHFPVPSFSPFYMVDKADHQSLSVFEVTRDVFDSTFQLATCDLLKGKFMACTLQYRGLCSPKNVNDAVADIKKRPEIQFVEWCPTGFKMGICRQPTLAVPNSEMSPCDLSVCCLANNTNVEVMWQRLLKKFEILYSKRSFVHWYVGEGMEEGEFLDACDGIKAICKDYVECGESNEENEGGLEEADIGSKSPKSQTKASPKPFNTSSPASNRSNSSPVLSKEKYSGTMSPAVSKSSQSNTTRSTPKVQSKSQSVSLREDNGQSPDMTEPPNTNDIEVTEMNQVSPQQKGTPQIGKSPGSANKATPPQNAEEAEEPAEEPEGEEEAVEEGEVEEAEEVEEAAEDAE